MERLKCRYWELRETLVSFGQDFAGELKRERQKGEWRQRTGFKLEGVFFEGACRYTRSDAYQVLCQVDATASAEETIVSER